MLDFLLRPQIFLYPVSLSLSPLGRFPSSRTLHGIPWVLGRNACKHAPPVHHPPIGSRYRKKSTFAPKCWHRNKYIPYWSPNDLGPKTLHELGYTCREPSKTISGTLHRILNEVGVFGLQWGRLTAWKLSESPLNPIS